MAVDYIFVGVVFTFSLGTILTLSAFAENRFPISIIYHFIGAICYWLLGILLLMNPQPVTIPLSYLFWALGFINFLLFIVWGLRSVLYAYRKRKYGEYETDEY